MKVLLIMKRASSTGQWKLNFLRFWCEDGIAALIALIALSIFSLIGLSMVLNATTEVRVSDNYESQIQANNAALAGIDHTRELLRGVLFNELLTGPDGTADTGASYLMQARTFGFRNPLSWATARSLNILNPVSDVGGLPDDGILNTGHIGGTDGTVRLSGWP